MKRILLLFLCFSNSVSMAQPDSVTYQPARAKFVGITLAAGYVGSMTGLYKLWYADYPSSGFHFFDDGHEWKRMDKFGHAGSAYYLSRWNKELIEWTGTHQKKSAVLGTSISYLFLSTIEIFDAYSANWGFSVPDAVSNTAGCALYLGQELLWKEQRLVMKFSYRASDFASYRPDALGETVTERIFKDYNAQTYWLSGNIYSFLRVEGFPKWINLAAGYGATGMVTAYDQVFEINKVIFPEDGRLREYYLGLDIDLTRIGWNSKFLNTVAEVIGFIKIPLPAIKFTENHKPEFMPFGF